MENANIINMLLTISVTNKIPGVHQNPFGNSLKNRSSLFSRSKEAFWVPYDDFMGIAPNGRWCVVDNVESYIKYLIAFWQD